MSRFARSWSLWLPPSSSIASRGAKSERETRIKSACFWLIGAKCFQKSGAFLSRFISIRSAILTFGQIYRVGGMLCERASKKRFSPGDNKYEPLGLYTRGCLGWKRRMKTTAKRTIVRIADTKRRFIPVVYHRLSGRFLEY